MASNWIPDTSLYLEEAMGWLYLGFQMWVYLGWFRFLANSWYNWCTPFLFCTWRSLQTFPVSPWRRPKVQAPSRSARSRQSPYIWNWWEIQHKTFQDWKICDFTCVCVFWRGRRRQGGRWPGGQGGGRSPWKPCSCSFPGPGVTEQVEN